MIVDREEGAFNRWRLLERAGRGRARSRHGQEPCLDQITGRDQLRGVVLPVQRYPFRRSSPAASRVRDDGRSLNPVTTAGTTSPTAIG